MYYGKKINVKEKTPKDVKKTEPYGTPNVKLDSTPQVVVFVPPTVPPDGLISEFLAKNLLLMVEELDMLYLLELNVQQKIKRKKNVKYNKDSLITFNKEYLINWKLICKSLLKKDIKMDSLMMLDTYLLLWILTLKNVLIPKKKVNDFIFFIIF